MHMCSSLPGCPECYSLPGKLMGFCNNGGVKKKCDEDAPMSNGGYGMYGLR